MYCTENFIIRFIKKKITISLVHKELLAGGRDIEKEGDYSRR